MPYIKKDRRKQLDPKFLDGFPVNAGELNWLFTDQALAYLRQKEKVDYAALNEVIGVLESCKLEMYRRLISTYEDEKIKENGDVY